MEITEKETERMNSGRLVRAEATVLIPLLAERKASAVTRLTAVFRSGAVAENLTALVAEITTLEDLEREIKRRIKETEHIERKIYASTDGN